MDRVPTNRSVTLLRGVGNLINLLPTGTVFFYQIFSPVATNYGHCHAPTKGLAIGLIALSGLFCIFVSFTDSYIGADGKTHYAIVTFGGLQPRPTQDDHIDLANYRLRFGDFVHALLATIVFVLVVLFDKNSVDCLFPSLESHHSRRVVLMVLSTVASFLASVGLAGSMPGRNWFGYPPQRLMNPPNRVNDAAH